MEGVLIELCDQMWICNLCLQPELLLSGSSRVFRSHLDGILAVSRFLSKGIEFADPRPKSIVLEFFRAIPSSFRRSFWPLSFSDDSISSFFTDFLRYISETCKICPDFETEIALFGGEVVLAAIDNNGAVDSGICTVFLSALAKNFPPISPSDANKLVPRLLDRCVFLNVESLEKHEIAFKLITHILDKVQVDSKIVEQVGFTAKSQLQSTSAFLKIRKPDWNEQELLLKARIYAKLSLSQSWAKLIIKSLASLDLVGITKRLACESLSLLIDASEACLIPVWSESRVCKELFSSLLAGISQIAFLWKGQAMQVSLTRLKPLVLTVCSQADTGGSSQGTIYESVFKTCCGIIESGWTRCPQRLATFIVRLASSIDERNDHNEQVDKKKQQLNVVRLLADLTVAVKNSEVVNIMLQLFVNMLEEGDASAPGPLRLQIIESMYRLASLGLEESYRETVSTSPLQAVGVPYMLDKEWSSSVQCIAQRSHPLAVKWLEDELEVRGEWRS